MIVLAFRSPAEGERCNENCSPGPNIVTRRRLKLNADILVLNTQEARAVVVAQLAE